MAGAGVARWYCGSRRAAGRRLAALVALLGSCQRGAELGEFDLAAAQASARQAAKIAALDCYGRSGPGDAGQVELQFEPGGTASPLRVLPEALGGSARGACIERVFRFEAAVAAFRGSSGTLVQAIDALPIRLPESAYPRVAAASAP